MPLVTCCYYYAVSSCKGVVPPTGLPKPSESILSESPPQKETISPKSLIASNSVEISPILPNKTSPNSSKKSPLVVKKASPEIAKKTTDVPKKHKVDRTVKPKNSQSTVKPINPSKIIKAKEKDNKDTVKKDGAGATTDEVMSSIKKLSSINLIPTDSVKPQKTNNKPELESVSIIRKPVPQKPERKESSDDDVICLD